MIVWPRSRHTVDRLTRNEENPRMFCHVLLSSGVFAIISMLDWWIGNSNLKVQVLSGIARFVKGVVVPQNE